jgi:putative membrane protein (TIGR04086 family)
MEGRMKRGGMLGPLLAVLVGMYVFTGLLLLLLAFIMYKMEPGEAVVNGGITVIYVLVGFFGGFFMGKAAGKRKYLWGLLAGLSYVLVLFLVGLLLHKGLADSWVSLASTLVLCAASATAGGMLS